MHSFVHTDAKCHIANPTQVLTCGSYHLGTRQMQMIVSWPKAGSRNTSLTLIFSNASVARECFSHNMCRTFTALATLSFT